MLSEPFTCSCLYTSAGLVSIKTALPSSNAFLASASEIRGASSSADLEVAVVFEVLPAVPDDLLHANATPSNSNSKETIKNSLMIDKPVIFPTLFFAKCLENFVGMFRDIDLVENPGDLSVLIYKKGLSHCTHVFFSIHRFFAP